MKIYTFNACMETLGTVSIEASSETEAIQKMRALHDDDRAVFNAVKAGGNVYIDFDTATDHHDPDEEADFLQTRRANASSKGAIVRSAPSWGDIASMVAFFRLKAHMGIDAAVALAETTFPDVDVEDIRSTAEGVIPEFPEN